uniref:Uncharacterized protein n=1 Tax=Hucho hucho TaxID=62062 RepID=A0A4W5MRU7_9TELE
HFSNLYFFKEKCIIDRICNNGWGTCPPPSIGDLQDQWPFLFTNVWLCDHFNTLTSIVIDSRLTQVLLNKGKRIVNFFKSQKTKLRREIQCLLNEIDSYIRGNDDLTATAAILLLMTHFKEKDESLFLLADEILYWVL